MPLGSVSPFLPSGTVSVSVGSTSSNVALSGGGDSIVITNTTNSLVYVRFGSDPSVVATTADMPVLGNSQVIVSVNSLITYGAAVSASGSGNVLFSRGTGTVI